MAERVCVVHPSPNHLINSTTNKFITMENQTIKYIIDFKSTYGNYSTFEKEFNNENHFNNWYDLMSRKGHKIIGVHLTNDHFKTVLYNRIVDEISKMYFNGSFNPVEDILEDIKEKNPNNLYVKWDEVQSEVSNQIQTLLKTK